MLRRRVRSLPCLSVGYFLLLACMLFLIGAVFGVVLEDRVPVSDAARLVLDIQPASLRRFTLLLSRHLLWLFPAMLLSLTAVGSLALLLLICLRGTLLCFAFAAVFHSVSVPVLLLRTLLVAVLCCAPLLVFAGVASFRAYRTLLRLDIGGRLSPPAVPVLLFLGLVVLTVICSFAELWLLPGFASYIQLFT